jgi:hypothetical protein
MAGSNQRESQEVAGIETAGTRRRGCMTAPQYMCRRDDARQFPEENDARWQDRMAAGKTNAGAADHRAGEQWCPARARRQQEESEHDRTGQPDGGHKRAGSRGIVGKILRGCSEHGCKQYGPPR